MKFTLLFFYFIIILFLSYKQRIEVFHIRRSVVLSRDMTHNIVNKNIYCNIKNNKDNPKDNINEAVIITTIIVTITMKKKIQRKKIWQHSTRMFGSLTLRRRAFRFRLQLRLRHFVSVTFSSFVSPTPHNFTYVMTCFCVIIIINICLF